MMWLPDVKKIDDMFRRFDRIPACDGQIDGPTKSGLLATALSVLCIASRDKNE